MVNVTHYDAPVRGESTEALAELAQDPDASRGSRIKASAALRQAQGIGNRGLHDEPAEPAEPAKRSRRPQ